MLELLLNCSDSTFDSVLKENYTYIQSLSCEKKDEKYKLIKQILNTLKIRKPYLFDDPKYQLCDGNDDDDDTRRQNSSMHGMYLPHGYFVTHKTKEFIEEEVKQLKTLRVKYQFCNLWSFDCPNPTGYLDEMHYSQLKRWTDISKEVDSSQLVIAYLSGSRDNVLDENLHEAMANTCQRIIKDTGCDGVLLDFEPLRTDKSFVKLMKVIRKKIGEKLIIVASSAHTQHWSKDHIKDVAKVVDVICPMCYDSGFKTGSEFSSWINKCIKHFQCCLKYCELCPTLPAFNVMEDEVWHDPAIENIEFSAQGCFADPNTKVTGYSVWWWYEMTEKEKEEFKHHFCGLEEQTQLVMNYLENLSH